MTRRATELRGAVLTIVVITIAYVAFTISQRGAPSSGGLAGHLMGVVGFIMMMMTASLYSLRKRSKKTARWGSMQSWLQFHIFTGLVGPYLVLLHTSWQFNGLAGMVTLFTVLIVLSGIIGRYIYTAVPRTSQGVELDSQAIESQMATSDVAFQDWLANNPTKGSALPADVVAVPRISYNTVPLVFGRPFIELRYRWRWWLAKNRLASEATTKQQRELGRLLAQRRELRYQIASLALVRRTLALWHSVHNPISLALFTLAFIHIGAALYYVTLAR